MYKFQQLAVYQLALEYVDQVYGLSGRLPESERFNLRSQWERAVTSIVLNIAEGSTGQSDTEQNRFLGLALRSYIETVACLDLIERRGYLCSEESAAVRELGHHLFVKLQAFRRRLMEGREAAGQGRKVLFIGNGGSAAIASHQAVDYWKNAGLRALTFNDASLLTCISNDYGYPQVFAKSIQIFAEPGDVLVAISSSGRSANILHGVEAARERRCAVITLSGFSPENDLRRLGNVNFQVPANSYGHVEIAHLAILHCALDMTVDQAVKARLNNS